MQNEQQRDAEPEHGQDQRSSNRRRGHRQILNRGTEPERRYFRCGRYFTVGHEWYAATREGRNIGPFATRHQVEVTLARYLSERVLDASVEMGQLFLRNDREMTELEVLIEEFINCRQHTRFRSANSAYVWAQQRLKKFEEHAAEHDHPGIRIRVLRHFMSELE